MNNPYISDDELLNGRTIARVEDHPDPLEDAGIKIVFIDGTYAIVEGGSGGGYGILNFDLYDKDGNLIGHVF